MSLSPFDSDSEDYVWFGRRLLIYLSVWFLAVLVCEVFLRPEGFSETSLTPFQQRIRWPLYAPLMAVVGLAQSVTWPTFPGALAITVAAVCLILQAIVSLTRSRSRSLVALTCVQALLLTVAVVYLVRLSKLPTGG
jgi:cbb3-type cytochrome oxidase subunit 1